jgi:hypothetical protein
MEIEHLIAAYGFGTSLNQLGAHSAIEDKQPLAQPVF